MGVDYGLDSHANEEEDFAKDDQHRPLYEMDGYTGNEGSDDDEPAVTSPLRAPARCTAAPAHAQSTGPSVRASSAGPSNLQTPTRATPASTAAPRTGSSTGRSGGRGVQAGGRSAGRGPSSAGRGSGNGPENRDGGSNQDAHDMGRVIRGKKRALEAAAAFSSDSTDVLAEAITESTAKSTAAFVTVLRESNTTLTQGLKELGTFMASPQLFTALLNAGKTVEEAKALVPELLQMHGAAPAPSAGSMPVAGPMPDAAAAPGATQAQAPPARATNVPGNATQHAPGGASSYTDMLFGRERVDEGKA